MQNNAESQSGTKEVRKRFQTIDYLARQAEDLLLGLRKLAEVSHPLDIRRSVRKGVGERMIENSVQISGSGRTYFLAVERTKEGKLYLKIAESPKGQGGKFDRNSILVFPEEIEEFVMAVTKVAAEL